VRACKKLLVVWAILALGFLLTSCDKDDDDGGSGPVFNPSRTLDSLLESELSTSIPVYSAVAQVEDPARHYSWTGSAGVADPETDEAMTIHHRFRIASVTKPMTASLILRLMEENFVNLDSTAWYYLSEQDSINFDSLHIFGGHSYGRQITVRQLLNHSSGLPDYVFDGPVNMLGLTDFMTYALTHPDKQWLPYEMLQWSYRHLDPYGAPGNGYHYSDTGYVLLGLIAEAVTGESLATLYREYLFDPLGMDHAYLQFYENEVPGGQLSHPFFSVIDVFDYNTSFEWAGGGVVCSVDDLTKFIRALGRNTLFASPSTRDLMFEWIPAEDGAFYGLGVEKRVTDNGEFIGHPGAYGSFAYYWLDRDISVTGTLNQLEGDVAGLLYSIVDVME
jgi:D-alanyl-D-alanine carboxypeptidase